MIYFSMIAFIIGFRFVVLSWTFSDKVLGGFYFTVGTIALMANMGQISEQSIVLVGIGIFSSFICLLIILGKLGKQKRNDEEIV